MKPVRENSFTKVVAGLIFNFLLTVITLKQLIIFAREPN